MPRWPSASVPRAGCLPTSDLAGGQAHPRVVGQPLPRLDAVAKVTGCQPYLSDAVIPGALWAELVRSPHPHALVRSALLDDALRSSGVVAAFTADDMPMSRFNTAAAPPAVELTKFADRSLLTKEALFVGDGVAVVVAETRAQARRAAQLVNVTWEPLEPVFDPEESFRRGHVICRISRNDVSTAVALERSDIIVPLRCQTPAVQHVCLETHTCAALPTPMVRGVTVLSNTQAPSDVRRLCSDILGLPTNRIRVRKFPEGGGFGCKQEMYGEALASWLALRLKRPVRFQHSRRDEFRAATTRHAAIVDVRLGFRRDGTLLACDVAALLDAGAYASHSPYVIGDLCGEAPYTYPGASHTFHAAAVRTNKVPAGAYRGYGAPQANFAVEQAMDLAAQRLGIDAVELRLLNGASPEIRDPLFGEAATDRLRHCLEAGTNAFAWEPAEARSESSDFRRVDTAENLRRGSGVAVATMISATQKGPFDRTAATVRLDEDGTATLITATCDGGTGSSTVLAQVVAEELALRLEDVVVVEGDTALGLPGLGSFSQRSVFVGAGAARRAAAKARKQLLAAVSEFSNRSVGDLEISDGVIRDAGDSTFQLSVHDVCRKLSVAERQIVAMASYEPKSAGPTYAACFVDVVVDRSTGRVGVDRCLVAIDCGRVLNPLGATGQVQGGAVQGLGNALYEEYTLGPDGSGPASVLDHGVPGICDVPAIEAIFVDRSNTFGPYGSSGLGEIPIVPVAAAVANAVADATGVRITELPMRPDRIWRALAAADQPMDGHER